MDDFMIYDSLEYLTEAAEENDFQFIDDLGISSDGSVADPTDTDLFYENEFLSDPAGNNDVVMVDGGDLSGHEQAALSDTIGSILGDAGLTPADGNNTYNIYNITLEQVTEREDLEEPEESIEEEEEITESAILGEINNKLDSLSTSMEERYNEVRVHYRNMEEIGKFSIAAGLMIFGGLIAFAVFNHIRP